MASRSVRPQPARRGHFRKRLDPRRRQANINKERKTPKYSLGPAAYALSHKETPDVLIKTSLATKYIELLKKSLNNELYLDNEARYRLAIRAVIENRVATVEGLYDLTQHHDLLESLLNCKQRGNTLTPVYKETGLPAHFMRNFLEISHTMIGHKRLDNIQYCIEAALNDNIEGDIIETGIWRGGAIILICGILAAYGITDRIVWAADSFAGVPVPTLPEDHHFDISERVFPFLTVGLYQRP
jgi:hypothetical protein